MKKILISVIVFLGFIVISTSVVRAVTVTRSDAKIDESLSDQSLLQYAQPTKILLSRISTDAQGLRLNSESWFKAMYYYSITRLGYADLPFTYVLDRNGDLYDGRKGGPGVIPELYGAEGAVTIGYLSNSSDITPISGEVLEELIHDLSYEYGIDRDKVLTVSLNRIVTENGVSKSTYEEIDDSFSDEVQAFIKDMTFYSKEHISYKAEIKDVKYEPTVKAGEKLKVEFSLVNKNSFPWFTNATPIYISTADGTDSPFAVNGVWDSFSKPAAVTDKTILPGETLNLSFDLQALLLPGKQKANFKIMKLPESDFKDGELKVVFEITEGDFDLVRVSGTPGGVLNVRTCPSGNCESISQVSEGQIFISTEESVGWYKIKYADKKEGWVYGPYIVEL